ncbi:hypothetical protein EG850_11055 [Gulosibacter macacae]|uniref:Uncharacterized protein n=1 Tax=Gulosibacter macacae TaxID=2488791 RepID=A0A3P3VWC7_9MICO|nr:hypothetical protein [Gulosibacter macacae]RRJ85916.1 hypothetical protein EG850_11055 [Gulosibacter macacae]
MSSDEARAEAERRYAMEHGAGYSYPREAVVTMMRGAFVAGAEWQAEQHKPRGLQEAELCTGITLHAAIAVDESLAKLRALGVTDPKGVAGVIDSGIALWAAGVAPVDVVTLVKIAQTSEFVRRHLPEEGGGL